MGDPQRPHLYLTEDPFQCHCRSMSNLDPSFGSNFIPDPEKKLFYQDGCIEALHCQKNHIIQYKCHFYSLFLLDFPTILSKNHPPKEKTKKLSKMFSWTERNH